MWNGRMKKLPFVAALLVFTSYANAALVWVPALTTQWGGVNSQQFLTIDSYRFYYNGYSVVLQVNFKPDGWVNTGCAASDNGKMVSYWAAGNANSFHQILHASIVEAMAQGKKVRVSYENTICDVGAGRMFYGIETQPPSTLE